MTEETLFLTRQHLQNNVKEDRGRKLNSFLKLHQCWKRDQTLHEPWNFKL